MRLNYKIIIAMFVLAVFAVGAVSAAENTTTDIVDASSDEVAVEEIVADEVSDELAVDGTEDINDDVQTPTRTSYTVNSSMTSSQINDVITFASENGGGTINFEPGTYSAMALTLKNNTHLIGQSGVLLLGNSYNHVIEVANVENFTISNLVIHAYYLSGNGNVSAIHGSFATNGLIYGNNIHDAYDGININKKYDNLTIENNEIYHMARDGISLANPQNNDNYQNIIGANIINNYIETPQYGIFIGGTFKGNISKNKIYYSQCGIQFLGKPNNTMGYLNANMSRNSFRTVTTGMELYNPHIIYLNFTSNNIQTNSPTTAYTVKYNNYTSNNSFGGYVEFSANSLSGCILRSFINNYTNYFNNINNGTIIEDVASPENEGSHEDILGAFEVLNENLEDGSSTSDLIVNPDFSNGLTGWTYKDVSPLSNEGFYNNYCVKLNNIGSYISQNINWTLIDKVGIRYKFDSGAGDNVLKFKIGEITQNIDYFNKWGFFEFDTSSIEGFANLTLTSSNGDFDWDLGPIYIDSIRYELKSEPIESDDLIVNPDFSNGLSGWNYTGAVYTYQNGHDGLAVSLIEVAMTDAKLYQNVNWSSIEKISFYYKSLGSNSANIIVYIGQESILNDVLLSSGDWRFFEYDTKSIEGSADLIFLSHGGSGSEILLDSIECTITKTNSTISLESSGTNVIITLTSDDKAIEGATLNYTTNTGITGSNVTDANGQIVISGLIGLVNITVTYEGGVLYNGSSASQVFDFTLPTTIAVSSSEKGTVVIKLTGNNTNISNAAILYSINGVNKTGTTNANGQIVLSDLIGLVNITATFEGSQLYKKSSESQVFDFTVPTNTNITIPEITAGKATTTTIKLPENATGNITVTIDGKVSTVVNLTNGSATITIPELTAGKHDVVISYSGDGTYAGFSQNSTVEVKEAVKPTPNPDTVKPTPVKKQATKIVAKKKTFKSKVKVKKYAITLKTKAGKAVKKVKVTLKINGKTYKATTNAKGKATFKIKKLTKKGKYTATIKFAGNKLYNGVTKKVKITVKK